MSLCMTASQEMHSALPIELQGLASRGASHARPGPGTYRLGNQPESLPVPCRLPTGPPFGRAGVSPCVLPVRCSPMLWEEMLDLAILVPSLFPLESVYRTGLGIAT